VAIFLPQSKSVFYEIPKTGTSFVRNFLLTQKIKFEEMFPIRNSCQRHSPWYCYDLTGVDHTFASIRYPMNWYVSYWRFHRPTEDIGFEPTRFYIHRPLHLQGKVLGKDFNEWMQMVMDTEPAFYTRMVEQFLGPEGCPQVTDIIRLENIESELRDVLEKLGYSLTDKTTEKKNSSIWEMPAIRQSIHRELSWLEQKTVKRFYA